MAKIYETDPWLEPFKDAVEARHEHILSDLDRLASGRPLGEVMCNHLFYGLHRTDSGWVFREWAPNAVRIYLIGDFNNWKRVDAYALKPVGGGSWEISLPSLFIL